jgi:hypothetical protein
MESVTNPGAVELIATPEYTNGSSEISARYLKSDFPDESWSEQKVKMLN